MNDTFFQKSRNKFVLFFFCKIIIIIYKLRIIRHRQNCLGIGNKHIRQFGSPRISKCGCQHIFMYRIRICNTANLYPDIFLFPIVSLNSSIRSFNGDSVCPPYTCHNVTVTGSSFFFCPHPVKTMTAIITGNRQIFLIIYLILFFSLPDSIL